MDEAGTTQVADTVATTAVAVTVAVMTVVVARWLDVPVLLPARTGTDPAPLALATVVVTTTVVTATTGALAWTTARIAPGRRRPVVRTVGSLALGVSLLPVALDGTLTTANRVTLAVIHLAVGITLLRRLGR